MPKDFWLASARSAWPPAPNRIWGWLLNLIQLGLADHKADRSWMTAHPEAIRPFDPRLPSATLGNPANVSLVFSTGLTESSRWDYDADSAHASEFKPMMRFTTSPSCMY